MVVIRARSKEDTLRLGEAIGVRLRPGSVVCLTASLGAGKTWLTKGLARGIGSHDYDSVISPAFNLVHEYVSDTAPKIYHIDFYRLEDLPPNDMEMFEEYLIDDSAISIVEWGEKFLDSLVAAYLKITIKFCSEDESWRDITVEPVGRAEEFGPLLEHLAAVC